MNPLKDYLKNMFTDSSGKIVVGQRPNLPIIGWAVFTVLTRLLSESDLRVTAQYMAFGFLFTWAWLELTQGVNNFRRLLGAIVLVMSIVSKIT